jgi:hypothetical protein
MIVALPVKQTELTNAIINSLMAVPNLFNQKTKEQTQ